MQMLSDKKAISIVIVIILLLCAAVFGALLSYMWAMANFYLEPEKASLAITNVDFSPDHFDYFYITVMNPSNSPSKTNITDISFTVNGSSQVYQVTNTSPETLPIPLEIATNKTIKCLSNWGNFAGNTITVHVSALNASGAVASVNTSFVKLGLQVEFNPALSCKQFNITITNNAKSAINLTLTKLYVNLQSIDTAKRLSDGQNVSISGINLTIGQSVWLQCLYDWEGLVNPSVEVQTLEGYYANATANATASILLLIPNVAFNKTNSNEMSITVSNSNVSSTAVDVTDIVLTYNNGTQSQEYHINGSYTNPPFAPYYTLGIGKTVTFDHCIWNWKNFRDKNVTITVYTKQEYTPVSTTVKTPNEIVFRISSSFNLTDIGHFLVNITNMPCSLQNITVTQITLNTNQTGFTPQTIPVGEPPRQLNCTFNWTALRGSTVVIAVNASNTIVLQNVTLPYIQLRIISANFATNENGREFNMTIENVGNSLLNATITRIVVRFENETVFQNEGVGYVIEIGKNVILTFSWNWSEYESKEVTISVYTMDGLEFVNTFMV